MTVDLGRFHLFEGVSDSTKKRILSEAGNRVDLEKGERLCRAGSEPGGLILILKGKAEEKTETVLRMLNIGGFSLETIAAIALLSIEEVRAIAERQPAA